MKKLVCILPRLIVTAFVVVTTCSISTAQGNLNRSARASTTLSDTAFLRKNIMDNMMEIQLSEMGRTKATDDKIRSLAQAMVSDDTQMLNELQTLAKARNMLVMAGDNRANVNWGSSSGSGTTGAGMNAAIQDSIPGTGRSTAGGSAMGSRSAGTGSTMGSSGSGTTGAGVGTAGSMSGSNANTPSNTGRRVASYSNGTAAGMGSASTTNRTGANRNGTTISASGTSDSSSSATSSSNNSVISTNRTPNDTSNLSASTIGQTSDSLRDSTSAPPNTSGVTGMHGVTDIAAPDMEAMQALKNATGAQFNSLFVSQMLAMHNAKLAELQNAAITIKDPELKLAATKAIPKVRMHRDMLAKMNKGSSVTASGSSTKQ